jgi:hypothetical protein
MQVKGTSVIATKNFVEARFGYNSQRAWLDSLPEESNKIFTQTILSNAWYPFLDAFVKPTRKICDSFYNGSDAGAREVGKYSAEQSLKGIYRAFARVASVNFMLGRTANIFKTYYTPGRMELAERGEHKVVIHILDIDETDVLFESRICGWINGALLVCNNKDHQVAIQRSIARGDSLTEIAITL